MDELVLGSDPVALQKEKKPKKPRYEDALPLTQELQHKMDDLGKQFIAAKKQQATIDNICKKLRSSAESRIKAIRREIIQLTPPEDKIVPRVKYHSTNESVVVRTMEKKPSKSSKPTVNFVHTGLRSFLRERCNITDEMKTMAMANECLAGIMAGWIKSNTKVVKVLEMGKSGKRELKETRQELKDNMDVQEVREHLSNMGLGVQADLVSMWKSMMKSNDVNMAPASDGE